MVGIFSIIIFILYEQKMEERRLCQKDNTEEGTKKYKELKQEIQKLCRHRKNEYFNEKCKEIEKLEATHNSRHCIKKLKRLFLNGI